MNKLVIPFSNGSIIEYDHDQILEMTRTFEAADERSRHVFFEGSWHREPDPDAVRFEIVVIADTPRNREKGFIE